MAILVKARLLAGLLSVLLSVLLLGGCALVAPQTEEMRQGRLADLPQRLELSDAPFFPQHDYYCGPAALATALGTFNLPVTLHDLAGQVYLPGRQGSLQVEMLAAPRRYGFVSYPLAPRFEDLLREVSAGNPVVVLQNYGIWLSPVWHYAAVVGYDRAREEVILRSGEKQRLAMPFGVLEYTWKESKYWSMVAVPPDRIPATATESGYLAAISAMEAVADHRAAKTAYATFLERWPDNLAAGIGLANAHYALGEVAQAEAVLRRTAERYPDSPAVLNNLAQTVLDLGRPAEALQVIERAAVLGGNFASAVAETRQQILKKMGTRPAAESRLPGL